MDAISKLIDDTEYLIRVINSCENEYHMKSCKNMIETALRRTYNNMHKPNIIESVFKREVVNKYNLDCETYNVCRNKLAEAFNAIIDEKKIPFVDKFEI